VVLYSLEIREIVLTSQILRNTATFSVLLSLRAARMIPYLKEAPGHLPGGVTSK